MSDKILSRERFLVEVNQSIANQRCSTPLDLHDLALRADRDQQRERLKDTQTLLATVAKERDRWKALAEAQPDAVQGLVEAMRLFAYAPLREPDIHAYHIFIMNIEPHLRTARAALKTYEESKAKGGE